MIPDTSNAGRRRRPAFCTTVAALAATLATALTPLARPAALRAQDDGRGEFTRQALLVTTFVPAAGTDAGLGRRAADAVRGRVDRLVDGKVVDVISGGQIRQRLSEAGFDPDAVQHPATVRSLGALLRADEYLVGTVERTPAGVRLGAELRLMRSTRLREVLPAATARDLDAAADQLARAVVAARRQLVPQRRCENHLREGRNVQAMEAARAGIAAHPRGTLARSCYVVAMRGTTTPHAEQLAAARELLALDSTSYHGLEAAAVALDSLRRRDEAAGMWLRLAASDTADLELAQRVLWSMHLGGNARHAEPLAVALAAAHPDSIAFTRLQWLIAVDNRNWPLAVRSGEALLARDSVAVADSAFVLRLVEANELDGRPVRAVELAARGVTRFPDAQRLYATYTRLVRAEADTALGRGLAAFPRNAELLALRARDLRGAGRIAEALDVTKLALASDPTLAQGELTIAQAELDLGRPDSALAAVGRAVQRGEDPATVAQFALSKGNSLLRAAAATKARRDYELALRFLAVADSVRPGAQSKFLVGTAALNVAQTTLTEAASAPAGPARCELLRGGAQALQLARAALEQGRDVSVQAAEQYLGYAGQLETHAQQQMASAACGVADGAVGR